jgi:hypothetical protein
MRYLRMKKRWPPRTVSGQVVVIPAANDPQIDAQESHPAFERVTGETTKTSATGSNGKARVTGLTVPYQTFPMR